MVELIVIGFPAAQGAVVFGTAWLALRLLKTSHWLARIAAMLLSWAGWIVATVATYFLLGGSGGLMEGGFLLLSVCATATLSSILYLVGWLIAGLIWPRRESRDHTLPRSS